MIYQIACAVSCTEALLHRLPWQCLGPGQRHQSGHHPVYPSQFWNHYLLYPTDSQEVPSHDRISVRWYYCHRFLACSRSCQRWILPSPSRWWMRSVSDPYSQRRYRPRPRLRWWWTAYSPWFHNDHHAWWRWSYHLLRPCPHSLPLNQTHLVFFQSIDHLGISLSIPSSHTYWVDHRRVKYALIRWYPWSHRLYSIPRW